ncbi:hypothetical protein F8388_021925 [Cannabis sativa]|uniref:DUF1985 domain-containing protein n=1 Tax=Cannabis sativa TaxID=3483 RepID=A0A7J6EJ70_CANSA|nr:hypothetical protein F8388_021925 [Cannabis sativa]KAF4371010.1 hypothetical protein G4B88_031327 [Cannabis sativa]
MDFNVSITGGVWFEEGGKNRGSCKTNLVGSGSKVVDSDKEKKNKNVSISKRSGVSEASFDDRCSKKLKSVVEDDDDFDSECDEAPIMLPKKLKDRLTTKKLTMFQESCFGHFLDLEECNMQSQVIHTALCREVRQVNVKEIWFDFRNSRTQFGLGEFAIMSGLLCKGDSIMEKYIGRGDTFVDKYFSDMTVNYVVVKQRFLNSIFKDDVFAFRMVVLYFVMNFLLSKPGRKKVDDGLLHLIGSGEFNNFPWGKVAYDTTLYSLRTVLKDKNKKKVVNETKAEENQKLDIAEFEFSYESEFDDDFEDVRQPRVDVDKTGSSGVEKKATISVVVLDELKDSVLGLVVRQVGLECVLKEFHLIKDSIANVVPQSHEDEDEDDGGGGGVGSPRNLDDISDDVEPTVKGEGEDAGDVKDGKDCVDGDEIKNISEMSVKEVDSQDFDGLSSLEKDMPNFDIMGSLLGQTESVAIAEDEALGSNGGNVGGVEGIAEKVSAGTDDGFSESVMAVINQKGDDVFHAYEIKVCESFKSKRAHKPSVALQSPYRNDFGSSGSNEKKKKKNVKGLYLFTSGLFDPSHELQQKAFDEWSCVGFKDENKL